MKKVLALIIAAMMIVSMIPVMAITTSAADVEGNWLTWRSAAAYDEPEDADEEPSYTPAPGYEYNDEGLHLISPSYAGCTPFGTVQSRDKVNIKDGVYMQLRVDDFSYGGREEGAANQGFGASDNWISFSIWDSQKVAPGSAEYGAGWLSLIRHNASNITAQSFITNPEVAAQNFWHQGDVAIEPEVDDEGREIYTFEITNDGTNYTVSICGVPVQGASAITSHLNNLDPNGEFYIGVTFHSGVADGVLEATMLKFGTSAEDADTPIGDDSAEPEENINVTAEIADPSTVETNMPCLIFDATESSFSGKIGTSGMTLTAQGNNSYKVEPAVATGFHQWGIKKSLSYDAKDFPVISILIEDPNMIFESGVLRYSAGKNMSADDVHILNYSMYDDGSLYFGDDQYTLMFIDMAALLDEEAFAEGWTGRINGLRFDYNNLAISSPADPEFDYFFFHYAGIFRSVEEATAYGMDYMAKLGVESTPVDTEEPGDATEEPGDVTEEPGDATEEPGDATEEPAGSEAATQAPADAQTQAPADDDKKEEGGCGAVIGSAAVLLAAAAAAVVLKKRD